MTSRSLFPWLLRAAWVALPFAAGPAFAAGLRPYSDPVRIAAEVLLWAAWAVVLVGTLVPWPVGLTALRVAAPTGALTGVAAALTGRSSGLAAGGAVAITGAVAVIAFTPAAGLLYVNGPSYPNERRYPLRAPGQLLLGPLQLVWAVVVGGPVAGILLVAAKQWIAGAVVLALAVPASLFLFRSLHNLARRWVVFVPAGLVVHDPLSLADPVLFERAAIVTLRPAPAGSDALDLTQRAPGLAVELVLRQAASVTLVGPGRGGEARTADRFLFMPSRPGQVLKEAQDRRIPVG